MSTYFICKSKYLGKNSTLGNMPGGYEACYSALVREDLYNLYEVSLVIQTKDQQINHTFDLQIFFNYEYVNLSIRYLFKLKSFIFLKLKRIVPIRKMYSYLEF